MGDEKRAIGHKVKYALDIFDDDTMLFIGSRSAFFFIGTKQEFYETVEKASTRKKLDLIKQMSDAKAKIEEILTDLKKVDFCEGEIPNIHLYSKRLSQHCGYYESASQQLDAFFEFSERTVKDAYIRDSVEPNPKEIVLNVSGMEVGQYWTRSEWEKDNRKN